ncbi:MAG: RAMP superfamily CRISPR-associated protein [Bacteroidales bacterium]|nr:RAMP superfamily CRISPR-associated protein [Bacteroidales bacterium]
MKRFIYQIRFYTPWHAGSGLSSGAAADLAVIRDKEGFPFIPGKTLKGLLREAAETLNKLDADMVPRDFIEDIFGIRIETNESNINHVEALSFFSNAELTKNVKEELRKKPILTKHLVTRIASTAIDDNGQAKEHTLRQIEATVPMTLFAAIENFPDKPGYASNIELCMKWVRRIGMNRNRGFGRCDLLTYNAN